ncbi:MAG: NuoM family protein [Candidatus Gastranaerophilaceae bacterium]
MFNLLSLNFLIFSPILAAALIASPLFGTNPIYIRRFAKACATLHFMYSLLFIVFYNFGVESFYEEINIFGSGWLSKLGINAAFGLDGLTVILTVLTSFVFLLALIASKTIIRTKHKMYYSLMFILLSTILGIFCSKDMFVFLIFWEAELIPMYLLISQWGTGNSKYFAMKYLLFTFAGSIFLLVSMLGLFFYGYHANGELSSTIDFLRISMTDGIFPVFIKKLLFWGFFIGFAVKLPVVPLHTWLPSVNANSAAPINMLLSAIVLKTGAYGLIKFNLSLFPELFTEYAPIIMLFGVINIIWAALCAYKQKDIQKLIGYSSIVFMGLFLLGLSSLTKTGINGSCFVIISHAFIASGLFLISGLIYQVTKTKSLPELSGLGNSMPVLMSLTYIVSFAAIGMPFTIGFPSELLIFSGAFSSDFEFSGMFPKIATLLSMLVQVLSAAYILRLFHCVFCKTEHSGKNYHDISGHRLMCVSVICFCIILFGLFPETIMCIYENFTSFVADILRG